MLEREMYQEATMEVIEIQEQDVVTTSDPACPTKLDTDWWSL